jgi:hypothetical protein
VTNYRLQTRFGKVLFVYADEGLVTKLAMAAGVEPSSIRSKPASFSKFEFRKIDEFLEKGEKPSNILSMRGGGGSSQAD